MQFSINWEQDAEHRCSNNGKIARDSRMRSRQWKASNNQKKCLSSIPDGQGHQQVFGALDEVKKKEYLVCHVKQLSDELKADCICLTDLEGQKYLSSAKLIRRPQSWPRQPAS
jgi:hypothetical protein